MQLLRLQSVQNAAARLVTGTRRREHVTSVNRDLHWLPIRRRRRLGLASAPVSTGFGVDIGLPVSRLSACINCMLTPFAVVFVQPRWTFV